MEPVIDSTSRVRLCGAWFLSLVAVVICCVVLAAQKTVAQDADDIDLPGLIDQPVDPTTALINSLKTDGMRALRELWDDVGLANQTIFAELADSATLTIDHHAMEFDGNDDSETLLRITDSVQDDFHFLALSRGDDDSWVACGHINLWNQRQTQPAFRMEVLDDDRRWFVVRSLGGSGAGFEQSIETWYRPTGSAFVSVLSFPLEGQVTGHGLAFDRTFSGSLQSIKTDSGSPVITLNITATYTANQDVLAINGVNALFSRRETVQYELGDDEQFTINDEASTMSDVEVKGLFADDASGFLKHNFEQLRTLAETGNEPQQTWLRRFLESQSDSTEKSTLESALASRTQSDQ